MNDLNKTFTVTVKIYWQTNLYCDSKLGSIKLYYNYLYENKYVIYVSKSRHIQIGYYGECSPQLLPVSKNTNRSNKFLSGFSLVRNTLTTDHYKSLRCQFEPKTLVKVQHGETNGLDKTLLRKTVRWQFSLLQERDSFFLYRHRPVGNVHGCRKESLRGRQCVVGVGRFLCLLLSLKN